MNNLESEYRLPSDSVRLERDAIEDAIEAAQPISEVFQENTEILPTPERRLAKILALQESIREARRQHLERETANKRENRIYALTGNLMGRLVGVNPLAKRTPNMAMLIDQESYLGGQHVFEPSTSTPGAEVERRFFYDYHHATDSNDWFFEEKTTTGGTVVEEVSYWYKVKDEHGVYMSKNDDFMLEPVTGTELEEFSRAVERYHEVVHHRIYDKHPHSNRSDYDLAA